VKRGEWKQKLYAVSIHLSSPIEPTDTP